MASFDDKSSSNSKHTKLVRVESAWAANPVSNLNSHWTAPEDTAHGAACRTSRIASRRDLLNDDVESEVDLWPAAFLEDQGQYQFHSFLTTKLIGRAILHVLLLLYCKLLQVTTCHYKSLQVTTSMFSTPARNASPLRGF